MSQLLLTVQAALNAQVRPFLQSHGGDVEVVGIDGAVVALRMYAACAACELRSVTFASRVRAELLKIPGVSEVTCTAVPLTPARLDKIAAFFSDA
jgi:Fe-S cluster biogenesis protein NfuA